RSACAWVLRPGSSTDWSPAWRTTATEVTSCAFGLVGDGLTVGSVRYSCLLTGSIHTFSCGFSLLSGAIQTFSTQGSSGSTGTSLNACRTASLRFKYFARL